jgi:hypothetical protein
MVRPKAIIDPGVLAARPRGEAREVKQKLMKMSVTKTTDKQYTAKIGVLKKFVLDSGLEELSQDDFIHFLDGISSTTAAGSTIRGYRSALVYAQRMEGLWRGPQDTAWAQEDWCITATEGAAMRHKEAPTRDRFAIERPHLRQLVEGTDNRLLQLAMLLLYGGALRINELVKMRVDDLVHVAGEGGTLLLQHDKVHGPAGSTKRVDEEFCQHFREAAAGVEGVIFTRQRLPKASITQHIAHIAATAPWPVNPETRVSHRTRVRACSTSSCRRGRGPGLFSAKCSALCSSPTGT